MPASDDSICIYGAGVLLKHLVALQKEIEGVRTAMEDIEFIHRMRVASRRLRSAFPLFQDCLSPKHRKRWLKQIKTVTGALGEARDTDVQIERVNEFLQEIKDKRCLPGLQRLTLRLRQKRSIIQPHVDQQMEALLQSGLLAEMENLLSPLAARQEQIYLYTPAMYRHAFNAISARLDEFLSYDSIVAQPEQIEALHAMRIKAKWLRYTVENLAPLYGSGLKTHLQVIRKIQEALGDIHDADVWAVYLPAFMEEERQRIEEYFGHARPYKRIIPGLQYFLQNRQEERQRLYEKFVRNWQSWQDSGLWVDLRQEIKAPFFKSAPLNDPSDQTAKEIEPAE